MVLRQRVSRSDRFSSCSFLFITVTPESEYRQVPSDNLISKL
jgi:hypothetical protein